MEVSPKLMKNVFSIDFELSSVWPTAVLLHPVVFIRMFCSSADQIRDENSRAENRSSEKSVPSIFGSRLVLALS
jgi:hypothetical protein